jgi:isopentenyl diphosphate isomerase/L-lactate dehydrogenase-like FMN-dependent dehydrogenase
VYAEREYMTLHEFVQQARINLHQNTWDYLAGGSETETTQVRNRLALESLAFRPRVLRDVSSIDPSGDVLGERKRLPVILAPIGSVESFTPEGGIAPAQAADQFGCDHMLSSACEPGLEEVAKSVSKPSMYQLYVRGDRAFVEDVGARVIEAGYRSFCFTVDTAVYSRRERDIAKRYLPRGRQRAWAAGPDAKQYQAALNWKDVENFKSKFDIPLSLKGIMTAEDARIAVEHGVEVVYISNHGGRQLDHGRGATDALREIVDAVEGKAEVWVDGGYMRGLDMVKAIALGANAVGLGRLQGFALAAGGIPALVRALEIFENEVISALGLLGVTSLAELNSSHLAAVPPVPSTLNGITLLNRIYPHLDLSDVGY